MRRVLAVLLLWPTLAFAEPAYAPPDRELWEQMQRAIEALSMPLAAHQSVHQIFESVQREAQIREMRKRPPPESKADPLGADDGAPPRR